ncbi:MAG: SGNH/GDSL hydrolase family protein, partial [bacterium]|nr:SGNH/GDSL hydrolase family protein [bacterium]
MNRARRLLGSVGLALATIAATLLLLEIGVRIALGLDPNTFESLDAHRPEAARRQFRLIDLIRPSADDLVAYELRPGLRGRFRRQEIEINSLGMRGPERTLEKPEEGVFRIAALGDSHLFGWGVSYEHTFLALLEARLAERFPSRSFEALNLGVPGYNTVMEVQAFSRRVDLIDPDL